MLSGPTGVPSPSVLSGPTGAPSPSVLSGPTGAPSPSVLSGPTGAPSPSVLSGPTGAPSVLSGPTGQTNTRLTAAGRPLTHKARSTEIYSETVEALKDIGKLKERFSKLEACVEAVEEGKVDKSQLKQLITNKDSFDESNNLTDQLNQLKALVDNLMSDREKDKFMNLTSPDRKDTSEAASGSKELRQPNSDLRITMQKLEEDVTQLKDKQALTVGRATERDLQDQLDNLRGMLDDVMQSLTSQLTLNLSEAGQDESDDIQGLYQRKERSASRHSIVDTGRRISVLYQHYEELQDSVNSLLQQQTGATTGPLKDREVFVSRNVELGSDVKEEILQLQVDCVKLHETTRCLQDDNRQKQSHIEELYKTTEELQENLLWIEQERVRQNADKSDKVTCMQFDSAIEQLYAMFHEVLNKVTEQEQDWHKVIDRISTEMENKLNRIELESVKKQLEGRWKSIQQKLRAQEAPQHEGAAGIRKQLVDGFHCISCDRPVIMHTFGQRLVKQPISGFPSRQSIKPKQIYKLSDYTHLPASRNSGGSHTVTSSSQRRSGLYMNPHTQTDMPGVIQSEVDVLGQDGNIYKGRLYSPAIRNIETKLPTITTKDGMCKTKDMVKRSLSHKPTVSLGVHQPHSAKSSQSSRSASISSGRDWLASALSCTSRSSIIPTSPAAESNTESHADESLNL
ncbi:glutamine-rich protein 2 isoform X2 [Sebastes umbrosus]|uniref:glutamine-rich protein 2 isoform X2 n=1 Tax=Sebastes umbrosus TaxID=72105 RepID=UPI00189D74E1|nr:glutamine-rich protein 2 isoform X2 [Sebastes umbrosus]